MRNLSETSRTKIKRGTRWMERDRKSVKDKKKEDVLNM